MTLEHKTVNKTGIPQASFQAVGYLNHRKAGVFIVRKYEKANTGFTVVKIATRGNTVTL